MSKGVAFKGVDGQGCPFLGVAIRVAWFFKRGGLVFWKGWLVFPIGWLTFSMGWPVVLMGWPGFF